MIFRFKQFEVSHARSAHKVGVDGVLLGAWATCHWADSLRILDVGCGCGLIALMLAQRYPNALITAIDTDLPSAMEARYNVRNSPWGDRISVKHTNFATFCADTANRGVFDLVVSNPPYYQSGVDAGVSARMSARHCGALSPRALLGTGASLLSNRGSIALIMPYEHHSQLIAELPTGLQLTHLTYVRNALNKQPKRALIQVHKGKKTIQPEAAITLTIRAEDGEYSAQYRQLCRDFYLKF